MQMLAHIGLLLFCNRSAIDYFDSFGVGYVPEEIKDFIGSKNIIANIFQVQANNAITCGYICIGSLILCLQVKKLTDFMRLFSPYDFDKNDIIILSYFNDEWN